MRIPRIAVLARANRRCTQLAVWILVTPTASPGIKIPVGRGYRCESTPRSRRMPGSGPLVLVFVLGGRWAVSLGLSLSGVARRSAYAELGPILRCGSVVCPRPRLALLDVKAGYCSGGSLPAACQLPSQRAGIAIHLPCNYIHTNSEQRAGRWEVHTQVLR